MEKWGMEKWGMWEGEQPKRLKFKFKLTFDGLRRCWFYHNGRTRASANRAELNSQ